MWSRGTLLHCWWECKLVQTLWKSVQQFLKNLGIYLPQDSAVLLKAYTQRIYHEDTCSTMFIVSLFINWKQPRCPSTDEWIKKLLYIHIKEYYFQPLKMKFSDKQKELENTILSEETQIQKVKNGMYLLLCRC